MLRINDPELKSPSGCVLGPENSLIPGVGPDKHHAAFKFDWGTSNKFAGGRRMFAGGTRIFAGGRKIFVEPSNIANNGYTTEYTLTDHDLCAHIAIESNPGKKLMVQIDGSIVLQKQLMCLLDEKEWVNDDVINAYIYVV